MKLISPTNREVDIGQTLLPDEYIGMTRREVLDGYLRDRAISLGVTPVNALVTEVIAPAAGSTGTDIHFIRKPNSSNNYLKYFQEFFA
jgi:geranylgeranyl reductase